MVVYYYDIAEELGQRALVGKVNMDAETECPDFYVEKTEKSIEDTRRYVFSLACMQNKS